MEQIEYIEMLLWPIQRGHITDPPENLPLPAECSNALLLIYNVQDMNSVLRLKWAETMI